MSLKAFIRPALIVMIVSFVWRYARGVIAEGRAKADSLVHREDK